MTEFLIYQGKAAIALAVFYMFYRLLLSKETFHRFNRIVLLGTAALSFVLPLCVITLKEVVVVPAMTGSSETIIGEVAETVAMVSEVSVPIWPVVLCSIFTLGALAVVIHVVISIIGIRRMIRSGNSQALESGETLIITETDTAPFSWMKYIVISREDYESGYSQILTHEKAHIALRHSWDILFVDMITALQWFNPAIWMLKADLRALHEFEADDAVLRSGANIKEYQYLLIRKAVSKSGYSVANSFNHSTLKARITMMLNQKSSRMSAWKALYVIPLVGISLAATAETKVDYQYEDQQPEAVADTPVDKDTKKSFREKNLYEGRLIVDEANGAVTMIYYGLDGKEYTAEWSGLNLNENVYMINGTVVTDKTLFDKEAAGENVVVLNSYLKSGKKVMAVVTPDRQFVGGKAHLEINGNIVTYEDPQNVVVENVENANNVVRIGSMDENGNEVDVDMNDIVFVVNGERMPEGFDLNTIDPKTIASMEVLKTEKALQEYGTDEGVVIITTGEPKKNDDGKKAVPFQLAAQKPGFNGGDANEFSKYVAQNVVYPESCRQSKIEGRVTLEFTVTETGKVGDIRILRSVNSDLDREAVRVVAQSPIWTPERDENGKVVPVKYTFPVIFKLPDSENK
ncbi:MAG: TonB family protein [Bacteroidales bacterium]|nr:TonB family protein [Bacteroidales bacterium]